MFSFKEDEKDVKTELPKLTEDEDFNFSLADDDFSFKDDEKLTKKDDEFSLDNIDLGEESIDFDDDKKDDIDNITFDDMDLKNNKYNISEVSKNLGLDESLVKELVNDFISQVKSYKNDFDLAIKEQNYQNISKLFVKLKGVSVYLMIDKISEIIDDAQKSIQSNNISKVKEAISEINSYVIELQKVVS